MTLLDVDISFFFFIYYDW